MKYLDLFACSKLFKQAISLNFQKWMDEYKEPKDPSYKVINKKKKVENNKVYFDKLFEDELKKECLHCGHSKDGHTSHLGKDFRGGKCTELVAGKTYRSPPKRCPCENFI